LGFRYTKWIKMGQLSGLVCAFLYMVAVAAPLFLGTNPADALSWALYYEIGRTFSYLNISGDENSLAWAWFTIFTLSIVICFLDIRRKRFFASSVVLVLLLLITLPVIYVDFILEFHYSARLAVISPWIKIAFFVMCGNFMYLALRSRFFQYRRYRLAQRAEQATPSS